MRSLRTDAECPSLSPDQARIAHRMRLESKTRGTSQLSVLDLRTSPGSEATTSDVWVVPADGTGDPTVFTPETSSPAVVR
jgi:hypothetical protein